MNKLCFLLVSLYLFPLIVISQTDYFTAANSMTYGAKIYEESDYSNCRFCIVEETGLVTRYTPYEVNEYGFQNGRVFVAHDIKICDTSQKVFLERLVKGDNSLYFYKGKGFTTFFLSRDTSALVELPKSDKANTEMTFNEMLVEYTADCPAMANAAKNAEYNKGSLSLFIRRYNTSCERRHMPVTAFGFVSAYNRITLIPTQSIDNEYVDQIDFSPSDFVSLGIFYNKPLNYTDFSMHFELTYLKQAYSFSKTIDNVDVDFLANLNSVQVPVFFRYTFPFNSIRPFVNAGGILTYNFKNESSVYEAVIGQNAIEIRNTTDVSIIPKAMLGYSTGGGLEFDITYKYSMFFELRYSRLYGFMKSGHLNNSSLSVVAGINI